MKPTAIDLFCGAGGLTHGLVSGGFNVLAAFDNWAPAVRSYRLNFPDHPCLSDDVANLNAKRLAALGLMDVDLVAGGPPCQGFSAQRIGADEDHRNELVHAFGQVVINARARMFVMENVKGLLGGRGRATASRFIAEMEAAGYQVTHRVLDAADYGVPQNRLRVFFVGRRREAAGSFTFPVPTAVGRRTAGEALADLPEPPADLVPLPGDPLHRRSRLSELNQRRISLIPPGGGFEDLPVDLRANCHKNGAARIGHRAVYGRLHPDRPAGTITARFDSFTRGRFGHPVEPRNLTLREGARLQSFPDDHRFVGTQEEIAAQIGNAIPPLLAEAVAKAAYEALESDSASDRVMRLQRLVAAE